MRASYYLPAVVLFFAAPAVAHDFSITDVLVVFKNSGVYQIDMTVDVDALALGISPTSDSEENVARLEALSASEFEACVARAEDTLLRRTRVRFDGGEKEHPSVVFPEMNGETAATVTGPSVLGTTARLTGRVPEGATAFSFGASRSFRAVHLTIVEQATASGARFTLGPSEDSPPYLLGQAAPAASGLETALGYCVLGFEHIVPRGPDHILFVLGLFLLCARLRPLLWQITAFTVAHSLTLALSLSGLISLPSRWVEALIALSIVYVAVENLFVTELRPSRLTLVFGFGLLHGLGFAGVLRELGLPQGEFLAALVGFNVGVEAGQLAVVLLALLSVGWFRKHPAYRTRVVVPLSVAIGAVGLFWTIQRIL